jgi:hypothetical protein
MRDPLRDRALNVRQVQRCYRTPRKSLIRVGGRVCGSAWDNIVRSPSSCAAPAIRRTRCSAHRAGLVLHRTLPHNPPVGISPYVNVASAPVWAKKTLRRLLHGSATSRQGCSWRKVAAVPRFQCRTLQPFLYCTYSFRPSVSSALSQFTLTYDRLEYDRQRRKLPQHPAKFSINAKANWVNQCKSDSLVRLPSGML